MFACSRGSACCSDVQGDVLTAMYSLADHTLADWQSNKDRLSDQHYHALLVRATGIILLNPWVEDDQSGRRWVCFRYLQREPFAA